MFSGLAASLWQALAIPQGSLLIQKKKMSMSKTKFRCQHYDLLRILNTGLDPLGKNLAIPLETQLYRQILSKVLPFYIES